MTGNGSVEADAPVGEMQCVCRWGKQASDPKKAIKQMVGQEAVRDYYAGRPAQKEGLRDKVFNTVAWDDVASALGE